MKIVLDMDGVVFKSSFIKHQAFVNLFIEYKSHLPLIETYNLSGGGIPREVKIRYVLENILNIKNNDEKIDFYLIQYSLALEKELLNCPFVDGIEDFLLTNPDAYFYITTAAPRDEAIQLLKKRNVDNHFQEIFGPPTTKSMALKNIESREGNPSSVVFFGDSYADLHAAREVGISFIGVTCEKNDFEREDVPTINDFSDTKSVMQLINTLTLEK